MADKYFKSNQARKLKKGALKMNFNFQTASEVVAFLTERLDGASTSQILRIASLKSTPEWSDFANQNEDDNALLEMAESLPDMY
jgi:hypothetical protein